MRVRNVLVAALAAVSIGAPVCKGHTVKVVDGIDALAGLETRSLLSSVDIGHSGRVCFTDGGATIATDYAFKSPDPVASLISVSCCRNIIQAGLRADQNTAEYDSDPHEIGGLISALPREGIHRALLTNTTPSRSVASERGLTMYVFSSQDKGISPFWWESWPE